MYTGLFYRPTREHLTDHCAKSKDMFQVSLSLSMSAAQPNSKPVAVRIGRQLCLVYATVLFCAYYSALSV